MEKNMKKNHFNIALLFVSTMMLTGCFGHCADFNCTRLNPRWVKSVHNCRSNNYKVVLSAIGSKFNYQSTSQVQDSDIGQHISGQCTYYDGRYDVRKDKQYGHLFAK
ncbi:hypothetical protein NEIFLAOT_01047 [Neisseria flavescens NRL30031/H210]|uniref:Lipoprotein n=3 Tax=Neisseriaceae TaxID=481 RepID=C0EM81_NEIFL|nr:hypothetical protein NEIFLAOT_01047 [Neisseria flavescens NRL30031/H210]